MQMENIKCWEIDVRQVPFAAVLNWCRQHHQVDRLLLGIMMKPRRKRTSLKHRVTSPAQLKNAYRYFGENVLSVYSVKSWPARSFDEGVSPLLEIELNDEVIRTCLKIGPSLGDWTWWNDDCPLPEDPCLFKAGAKYPNLVSVAHEKEAWLLTDKKVDLPGVTLDAKVKAKDLFFDGRCFCKNTRPCRSRFMEVFLERATRSPEGTTRK